MLQLAREFMASGQRTEELFLGDLTIRQQKAKALDYCASQFLTEGEIKYCVAKIFSNNVKFGTKFD